MRRERQKGLEKHYWIGQAAEIIGLIPANFHAYIKTGKILATKTPGRH
ncbi:MAG: hypothetical protein ACXAEU_10315 [Candidatus Hodarchaeales archaeon]|jgi:hypothetical protein